jgi:excisionase family DNA binding protein
MIELNGETYLDGGEACRLLGIKVSTLYTYVSRGILRSYKQGIKRQRLYKRAELEALLQLRPSSDPAPLNDTSTMQDAGRDWPDIPHAEDWVPNV